jgi:integrase
MRLNEITGLDVEDVKQSGGVLYFDLTEAKSEAGVRFVPVHSALLAVGFREYLANVKSGPLWPGLKPGGLDGKRGVYASKRFTVRRRMLKLEDIDKTTDRDRLEFHSLRRSAITALTRARVPEADIAEIVGHEHPHITLGHYADRHLLARLQAIVEAITYPENE